MLDQIGEVVLQDSATAVGNGVPWNAGAHGYNALVLQVTGISTATVTFEATVDGSNWVGVLAENLTDGTKATTASADGLYRIDVTGLHQVRARISAYTAGTITVLGRAQA